MSIETLLWWQNYQHVAKLRLDATTDETERATLHGIAVLTSNAITQIGRKLAAESKATLARLDAEEVCS